MQRLERCMHELQASRDYIKALEYGMHAIISSHPAPDALAELWSHVLPELADVHGTSMEASPLFDAAFQQALSTLSEHINGAASRGGSEQ